MSSIGKNRRELDVSTSYGRSCEYLLESTVSLIEIVSSNGPALECNLVCL